MSREEVAWLAGLLEGEGHFKNRPRLRRGKLYLFVQINMTDEDVVRKVLAVTGIGNVTGPYRYIAHHTPIWRWQVGKSADIRWLLPQVLPYMGVRRAAKIRELLAVAETIGVRGPGTALRP